MLRSILLLLSIFSFSLVACQQKSAPVKQQDADASAPITKLTKTDAEWKAELTETEYRVLRKAGTERARTGDLWDHKADGVYVCRGCQLPLFDSETKFVSGTGWPSYYQPVAEENIGIDTDYKLGYPRSEVHCNRCDGHLGHVFSDGPKPTGLRYCINSVSLDFVPRATDDSEITKEP